MFLYIIYLICTPFIWVAIIISTIFNTKIKNNYFSAHRTLNQVKNFLKNNNKQILLFHAASAGEFEQLKPILRLIDRQRYAIIQSFTSSTIYNDNADNYLFDIKCYQPFDLIWSSYYYFKSIKPSKYIITRHDIWPNHLVIAKILDIKTYFINANIHKNSIWYYSIMQPFTKFLFKKLHFIHLPSNKILDNVLSKEIKLNNMKVSPDSRIAQVQIRSQNNILKLPVPINKKNTTIFGSIDKHDEDIIIQALSVLDSINKKNIKNTNNYYFLVPHEPSNKNLELLYQKLNNENLKYSILDFKQNSFNNIIIVNQVGLLADLYKFCNKAYIGGGFSRGVHSVLEPAVYNCKITFGPNIEMLNEAQTLIDSHSASITHDVNDLMNFLKSNTNHIRATLFQNQDIAEKILDYILDDKN